MTEPMTLDVHLATPNLDVQVDVHLRSVGERWVAAADIGGRLEHGVGASARAALAASLGVLSERARTRLLADPSLLGPSAAALRPKSY